MICATINPARLNRLIAAEVHRFTRTHPRSQALFEQAKQHYPRGVPMHWMRRWASPFPVFVDHAKGSTFTDVDGHDYVDFCLGDTAAMTGHSAPALVEALHQQAQRGFTYMLPTEDSLWVADELAQRFNLPYWQMALTATDANRFAIRLARHLTGRQKILIFNWCYHGTVDETFVTLQNGVPTVRQGNIGAPIDPSLTTKVIEFNDIHALQAALADEDVACVLTEPALTNIGIVHPEPGFHAALRKITRATGTLLIIDETHTICAGPGGYTRAHGLEPDILTIGKPIAGGVPGACYGFTEAVADLMMEKLPLDTADTGGIGGTLAGNAFSLAAMRSTLETTLTQSAFDKMIPLATRFREGVEQTIEAHNLPWNVRQLGARVEYWFRQQPPRNGGEAAAAVDLDLDRFLHLAALNRGILMTPFHNMALMSPETTADQVDFHTAIFNELVMELTADE